MVVARPLDNLILRSESISKEVRLLLESRVDTLWQGFKGSIFVTAIAGAVFFAVTWTALSFWSELFVAVASLGGAVAAHLEHRSPLVSHVLFGVYVGLFVWGGLYLRSSELRSLIPIARAPSAAGMGN